MVRGLRTGAVLVVAASLAGCTGYSPKSNFTLPSFPGFGSLTGPRGEGKATVMVSGAIEGLTCAESHVVLATAEGDGFKTVDIARIDNQFGDGAAVVDLDPGTYHVVQFACRNGAYVVHAGTNPAKDAVPWKADRWGKSLASFAVGDGEVVDAGQIVFTPERIQGFGAGINGRKANLSVRPSPDQALAVIVKARPDLAPRLRSNPMLASGAGTQALAKCRLTSERRIPTDGSSKVADVLAQHPEATPMFQSIGSSTTEADGCAPETGSAIGQALGQ